MTLSYIANKKCGVYTLLFAAGIEPSAPALPRLSKRMIDYVGSKLLSTGYAHNSDGSYEGELTRVHLMEIGPDYRWGTFEEIVSLLDLLKKKSQTHVTLISEPFHQPRIELIWKLVGPKKIDASFWSDKSEMIMETGASAKLMKHEFKKSIGMYVFALVYHLFGETGFDWLSKKKNAALNT